MIELLTKGHGRVLNKTATLFQDEIDCKCSYPDCKTTLIHDSLIDSFTRTRTKFNSKIIVTSGFRCAKHNYDIGGKERSYHLLGQAIDLSPGEKPLAELLFWSQQYFDKVLIYEAKNFIHCHNFIS